MISLRKDVFCSIGMLCNAVLICIVFLVPPALAIDVDLTLDQALEILISSREPMEKTQSNDEMFKIIKEADRTSRIGDDPSVKPCGSSVILRTKTYWFEYFGREEGRRSKVAEKKVRMPQSDILAVLDIPYLEVEIGLCGKEEFFAEGVEVAFQQGSKNILPVDVGKPSRGRKIPGSDDNFISRFSARFGYQDFDPQSPTNVVIFFPDGKMISLEADFAKIK